MFPFVSLVDLQDPQQWWQTGVATFEALFLFQPTPRAKRAWLKTARKSPLASTLGYFLSLELHLASLSEKGFEKLVLWRSRRVNMRRNFSPLSFPHSVEWETVKIRHLSDHYRPRLSDLIIKEKDTWKQLLEVTRKHRLTENFETIGHRIGIHSISFSLFVSKDMTAVNIIDHRGTHKYTWELIRGWSSRLSILQRWLQCWVIFKPTPPLSLAPKLRFPEAADRGLEV